MKSIVFRNPLRDLCDLRIDDLLHSGIHNTILGQQIRAVDAGRNDVHRRLRRRFEGTAGAEFGRHGGILPRVELAVRPDEPGRVGEPPARVRIDVVHRLPLGMPVGEVALGREEQRALPLPVLGRHEARDDGRAVRRRAVLPEVEGLVAQEPVPLPVDGVVDGDVGVDGRGGVVRVEAGQVRGVAPVAVAGAVVGQEDLARPAGVAVEGLLEADAGWGGRSGGGVGGRPGGVLDVVAELVEAGVAGVELVALPEPGAVFEGAVVGGRFGLVFFFTLYIPPLSFLFPLPSMTWHWGETLGFDIPREIGVVLDITKSELLLQRLLLDGRAVEQDAVDVVDHEGDVGAAVLRHALLDGGEVLPLFPSLSEEFDTRRSCTAWDSRNR